MIAHPQFHRAAMQIPADVHAYSQASRRRHCCGDSHGFTLIDALAAVAMVAIVAAAGMSSFDSRRNDLNTSVRGIVADVRWARARAIVSGGHVRFHATSAHSYQLEQLEEIDGQWQVRSVMRQVELPAHLELNTESGESVEFDSRGIIHFADGAQAAPIDWTIVDARYHGKRHLTLYPSGQLYGND